MTRTLLHRWEGLPRVAAEWSGPVLELWFWPTAQVWTELQDLIAAERALGPVLHWSLERAFGCPLVRIEAVCGCAEQIECLALFIDAHSGRAVGACRRREVWTCPG
jgi:hypothetical protein